MHNPIPTEIARLVAQERLPDSYVQFAGQWIAPLASWLMARRERSGGPLLVGVNGAQGTGKSTLCQFLQAYLQPGGACLTLSLDDYYLGRAARAELAQSVHPLLQTRGVPGTHDIALLCSSLDKLLAGTPVRLPRFNKASDDRRAVQEWHSHAGTPAFILLEGWCVGATPQPESALHNPVNSLEQEEDPGGHWRRYVNQRLGSEYADLFQRLDVLVMLQAPSMEAVLQWRRLQEEKLSAASAGDAIMDAGALQRFIQHYERLTRHCLAHLPARADYVLSLAPDHSISAVHST